MGVIPDAPGVDRLSVASVVRRVQCEIHAATNSYLKANPGHWLKDYAVGFDLQLLTRHDGGMAITLGDWMISAGAGIANLALIPKFSVQAERAVNVSFKYNLRDFNPAFCLTPGPDEGWVFASDLELQRWLDQVVSGADGVAADAVKRPLAFGEIFRFIVVAGVDARAGHRAARFSPSGTAGLARNETNQLNIALAYSPLPPPAEPLRVYVVNFPSPAAVDRSKVRDRAIEKRLETVPGGRARRVDPDTEMRLDRQLDIQQRFLPRLN